MRYVRRLIIYGFKAKILRVPVSSLEDQVDTILKEIGFIEGVDYLRQYAILSYVVDFYFPQKGLVIEVDGPIHEKPRIKIKDRLKDFHLSLLLSLIHI